MLMQEYLDEHGTTQTHVAKRCGIARRTVASILEGRDINLSVALRVEDGTKGLVTCRDLAPQKYLSECEPHDKSNQKKKQPVGKYK